MSVLKQLIRRKPDVEFFTRLSVEECQQRLSAALDQWRRSWSFRPDRPVIGKVNGHRFQMCKRIYYRNSFMPILHGELIPTPQGTYVRGSFWFHTLVILFLIVWFGFIASMLYQGILAILSGNGFWLALVLPIGFLVFAVLFVWIGSLLEKPSKAYVIAFLRRTLDFQPSPVINSFSIPTIRTSLNWRHVLTASLLGALFVVPGAGLRLLEMLTSVPVSLEAHDFLYSVYDRLRPPDWLQALMMFAALYAPALSGIFFAYLGTRRNRLVHPIGMAVGGSTAAALLGCAAGLVGSQLFVFPPFGLVDFLWRETDLPSLLLWGARTIMLIIACGLAGGFGGYLGWLFLAKKELEETYIP
jgi:hypothetical protein